VVQVVSSALPYRGNQIAFGSTDTVSSYTDANQFYASEVIATRSSNYNGGEATVGTNPNPFDRVVAKQIRATEAFNGSLYTDMVIFRNLDPGVNFNGIKSGYVSARSTSGVQTVYFGVTFTTVPQVVACCDYPGLAYASVGVYILSVGTTYFTYNVLFYGSFSATQYTGIRYIAVSTV